MSAWLEAQLGRQFVDGSEIELSKGLNFTGGITASLNAATKVTDVELAEDSLTPAHAAASASGFCLATIASVALTAGTPGTADDVSLSIPEAYRVADVWARVTTAIGGSTLQLRTATGGGGTPLSSSLSSASAGTVRNEDTDERSVSAGSTIYVRRSDRGVAGRVYLLLEKV